MVTSEPASTQREPPPVGVVFRDPPPPVAEARALELDIARELFGANELPIFLPAFQVYLNAIGVDGGAFVLRIGSDRVSHLALMRLERASAPDAPIEVEISQRAARSPRLDRLLAVLAERLRRGIGPERWAAAKARARRLKALPVDVPLEALRQVIAGVSPPAGLVRTGFRCNQDCGLCWQGRDWGNHGPEQVRTWIQDLARGGVRTLTISGGEPTLDPDLPSYVELARDLGFTCVQLETNAIQAARQGVAARLFEAGVTEALVSLHSPDPAVSDAITRAPGTHARTIQGVRALLEAGVKVRFNAVMTAEGLHTLPELPDYLREQFGHHPRLLGLTISYPGLPFDQKLIPTIVPPPEAVRAALLPTIRRASELGIDLRGLSGPCGVPLCAVDADPRVFDVGREAPPVPFRKHLPACDTCAVRGACYGVRHEEVALYGDRCVRPIVRS